MDIFKTLIDGRRAPVEDDIARSQLAELGGDFLTSLSAQDIQKFLVRYNIAYEDDLASASEGSLRAELMGWLVPPDESGAPLGAVGRKDSTSHTGDSSIPGKTNDPLSRVLEKLESFSSRLSALEGCKASEPPDDSSGWLEQLTRDAHDAVSESGFHLGAAKGSRSSDFSFRNRSASTLPPRVSNRGRSAGRSGVPVREPRGARNPSAGHFQYSRDRRGVDRSRFQRDGVRRMHAAEGPEFLKETFWIDTLNRFSSVRSRVDHANWSSDKMRREATTLAVVLDLLEQDRLDDLEEVVVRRLTALEVADSRGGRKDAWKLARHFESALTTDRIVVDPGAMRHARKCLKLDKAGDRSSSDSDAEPQAGRQTGGRGRGRRARG